jgi:hypothetical protein
MSGPVYKEFANETAKMSKAADNTLFLTPKERAAVRSMTFQVLDAAAKGRDELGKEDLPVSLNRAFPKLGNDLLYEWNMRRLRLRENTVDMLQMGRDAIRPIDLPGQ